MKRRSARLVALLAELDLTQKRLAQESQVCLSYVNRAIRGHLVLKARQQEQITQVINGHLAPWEQLRPLDIFEEVRP